MNEKSYIESYMPYQAPQSHKQMADDGQICYSYDNFGVSNSLSPATNFVDVCNVPSQNFALQQNSICVQQGQSDLPVWESRIVADVEKTMKISDKIDTIDISNKDLSPSTYCSNIDLIISESYKQNMSKDINNFNKFENEWYYSQSSYGHKNPSEYTSCAQEKFTTHCVQKNQDIEFVSRNYSCNNVFYENGISCTINNKNGPNQTSDYVCNYYDNKFFGNQSFTQNDNYCNTDITTSFATVVNSVNDQQTECSNDESDIIVEESDEEIMDYIGDQKGLCQVNKCLICNIIYKPLGTQFYFLTTKNPLTMCTQKPVIQTLTNIVGNISTSRNYLCSECLELINNIDHLHLKLEALKIDLITKFKKTCLENEGYCEKSLQQCKKQKKSRFNKLPQFKCKLCKKTLCIKRYCFYHLKRHKNRGYLCDVCGNIYSSKKKFMLHYVRHKKQLCRKIDSFKCSNCDKFFRTKSNKKEHQNYCLGILPFKCKYQYCDKKFPSTTKLKNHVKLKHDKKFVVICSICNIGFVKVSDYKNHIVSHSVDKKYSCPKCSKNYKTLSNLNFHMKVHSSDLPFSCHICKKGFMRKEYLEAHINNHNGIKNFSCTTCEKKFVSQKNLDAHLKYHEGTVKKSSCNICGKTMTSGFEEHLRIHNNLKEFECEHCNMKFNTKGALSKHVKKKH